MTDATPDPIAIDVGGVLRTVASLYSHLVTRPTGHAVRMAIETRLADAGVRSLSLIDLSEVTILDFSCADEVVAKLLLRYADDEGHEAFFVFSGVREPHRDQIVEVLNRRGLAAVAETAPGHFELLGERTEPEDRAWGVLEDRGRLGSDEVHAALSTVDQRNALEGLVTRRLAFRSPESGRFLALSRLVRPLM